MGALDNLGTVGQGMASAATLGMVPMPGCAHFVYETKPTENLRPPSPPAHGAK